jgi:hypothetical protein
VECERASDRLDEEEEPRRVVVRGVEGSGLLIVRGAAREGRKRVEWRNFK